MAALWLLVVMVYAVLLDGGLCAPAGVQQDAFKAGAEKGQHYEQASHNVSSNMSSGQQQKVFNPHQQSHNMSTEHVFSLHQQSYNMSSTGHPSSSSSQRTTTFSTRQPSYMSSPQQNPKTINSNLRGAAQGSNLGDSTDVLLVNV